MKLQHSRRLHPAGIDRERSKIYVFTIWMVDPCFTVVIAATPIPGIRRNAASPSLHTVTRRLCGVSLRNTGELAMDMPDLLRDSAGEMIAIVPIGIAVIEAPSVIDTGTPTRRLRAVSPL